MLFNIKITEEPKIINYLSFMFRPDEQVVHFNEIFRMMEDYYLVVKDMTFRSSGHLTDDHHIVTFGVTGTSKNLREFKAAVRKSKSKYLKMIFGEQL